MKYVLPFRVGIAVSKLRIATRSIVNFRPSDVIIASKTGSSVEVVGLWSHESDAIMATLITMHFRVIASRDQTRPSAWRVAIVS